MSTQARKAANSNPAKEVREVTLKAVESTKQATDSFVNASSDVMRDLWTNGSQEARKTQEKLIEMSREGAENFARLTEGSSKFASEAMGISRDNAEAFTEFASIAGNIVKNAGSDALNIANKMFAENIENSKAFFTLKTYNDFVEFGNQLYRSNIDNTFRASAKFTDYFFQFATEAFEPFNEKYSDIFDRLYKSLQG